MFKKYRILRKITQEELAELMDLSPRQLQRIENGESTPSLKTLQKLISILNIEDKDIIDYIKNS